MKLLSITEQQTKLYFSIAGFITLFSGLTTILSPISDTLLPYGLDTKSLPIDSFSDDANYGYIVTLIGILMLFSTKKTGLRVPVIIYATIEKLYLIGTILFIMQQTDAVSQSYLFALILDSLLCLTGALFLIQYQR